MPRKSRNANESAARLAMPGCRIDSFKIANQQQPEIDPRRQPWPALVSAQNVAHCASAKIIEPVLPRSFSSAD